MSFCLPHPGRCQQCAEEEDELCSAVWPPCQNISQPPCQRPGLPAAGFSCTSQQRPHWDQHHRQVLPHPISPFIWSLQLGLLDRLSHQGHHGDVQVNRWHACYKSFQHLVFGAASILVHYLLTHCNWLKPAYSNLISELVLILNVLLISH